MRCCGAELPVQSGSRDRDVSSAGGHRRGKVAAGETAADYPSVPGEGDQGVWRRGLERWLGGAWGERGLGILVGAVMSPWGLERGLGCRGRPRAGSGRCPPSSALVGVLDCPAQLSSQDGKGDLGDPPPTRPTVGVRPLVGLVEKAPPAVCKVLWVILSGSWNPARL